MKLWLSSFILIFSSSAFCSIGQLAVKAGSWSFETENVKSSSSASSGMGAYAFEISYGISPKFQGVFGINILMSEIYTGSSGYGFDLGFKYFPITNSGSTSIESGSTSLFIQEQWRPYLGLALRQRLFNLALSASYLGPGLSVGVDYAWNRNWFINAEARYDYLYGSGEALAKQMNILVGLGLEF